MVDPHESFDFMSFKTGKKFLGHFGPHCQFSCGAGRITTSNLFLGKFVTFPVSVALDRPVPQKVSELWMLKTNIDKFLFWYCVHLSVFRCVVVIKWKGDIWVLCLLIKQDWSLTKETACFEVSNSMVKFVLQRGIRRLGCREHTRRLDEVNTVSFLTLSQDSCTGSVLLKLELGHDLHDDVFRSRIIVDIIVEKVLQKLNLLFKTFLDNFLFEFWR